MSKLTNVQNLPTPLYEAIRQQRERYSRGSSDFTVTELLDHPHIAWLKRQHKNEIVEDAADNIYSFLGSALHDTCELAAHWSPDRYIAEQRFYANVSGCNIGGQNDLYDREERNLQDYKVCSVWQWGKDNKKWEEQLNLLRFLMAINGIKVDRLQIVSLYRDWSKNEVKRKPAGEYPPRQVAVIDQPVWPLEQAESFLYERVQLHKNYRGEGICDPESRWLRGEKYAVMAKGRKKAVKLFDTQEDAKFHITISTQNNVDTSKWYIEHRPGTNGRCEGYCPVNNFCWFYNQNVADTAN